jgi:hypothetical protein
MLRDNQKRKKHIANIIPPDMENIPAYVKENILPADIINVLDIILFPCPPITNPHSYYSAPPIFS